MFGGEFLQKINYNYFGSLNFFVIYLVLTLFLCHSNAANLSESKTKLSTPKKIEKLFKSIKPNQSALTVAEEESPQLRAQLSFEHMEYMSSIPGNSNLDNNELTRLHLQSYGLKENFFSHGADLGAGSYFSKGASAYYVSELYINLKLNNNFNVGMGRQRQNFSDLDSYWKLGLWQPRYYWDPLRSEEQGLTGLHLKFEGSWQKIGIFASPYFVPTMMSNLKEDDGTKIGPDRWLAAANQQIILNDRRKRVDARINLENTNNLINNPGSAFYYQLGRDSGPFTKFNYGEKPVNSLIYQRETGFSLADDVAKVILKPELTWHQIYGVDTGWKNERSLFTISYLHDEPDKRKAAEDKVIQQLEPLSIYSVRSEFNLQNTVKRPFVVGLSYMRARGGEITDINSNGSKDDFVLFTHRLNFYDSWRFDLGAEILQFSSHRLNGKWMYQHDQIQAGSLVSTEFSVENKYGWIANLGADILGVDNESSDRQGFLSEYRSNDRIYGGLKYVF